MGLLKLTAMSQAKMCVSARKAHNSRVLSPRTTPGSELASKQAQALVLVVVGLASGCLVTDPIDFERPRNNPPTFVVEYQPKLQVGDIKYVNNRNAASFSLRVRDPDVTQDLEVRWRVMTSDEVQPSRTIPLPAANGALVRDITIPVERTQLRDNQCHRVEVAVSSAFDEFPGAPDNPALFLATVDPDDIALFTFWIWEGDENGNDADKLIETCPTTTYSPPAASVGGTGGVAGVNGEGR
jgi:hypothetical protein